jgi:hypothetical protein
MPCWFSSTWQGLSQAFRVFGSSSGFQLPDGVVFSSDTALERWQAFTPEQRRGFLPSDPLWWWSWSATAMQAQ